MSKKLVKKQCPKPYIQQTLRRLQLQKFYLVGITGRTSFILQNLKGIKFKITIGNQLKCSCLPRSLQKNQHCNHTLYVLSQIFYIPHSNPLIWQSTYSDVELRYIIANRRIHCNKIYDFLKHVKNIIPRKNVIKQEEGEQDQDQTPCAICHMQIVKCDATTSCNTVCKNTFHLECFSQWVKHELQNNGVVKCPLCRDQKSMEIIQEIRQKEYEHRESINNKKIGLSYNYYCDGCQLKEIESTELVYKCVECEDVTLCEACFKLGRHIRHSFICKQVSDKKWKECEDRKGKKKWDFDQGLIRMKLPSSRKFTNFLACVLPCYFSKNTRWNIVECKKLDIKIQKLECIMCQDKQKAFLRRMYCGHFIHQKCLRKRIQKGRLYCKIDGQKFLQGYQSLRKHQELNRKVQEVQKDENQSEEEEKQERKRCSPAKSLKLEKSASLTSKNCIKNNRSLNDGIVQAHMNNRSLMSRTRCNPE